MEFKKNDLINETLQKYYETFSYTLDTREYVPDKYNKKIMRYIYKNMKRKFKQVNKEYKQIVKIDKQEQRKNEKFIKQQNGGKKGLFNHIKQFISALFCKKRSGIVKESAESEQSERINSESGLCSALDKDTSETNCCNTNPEQ